MRLRFHSGVFCLFSSRLSCAGVKITWKPGAQPVLIVRDNEQEVERIALSKLTREKLHTLMLLKGFEKRHGRRLLRGAA